MLPRQHNVFGVGELRLEPMLDSLVIQIKLPFLGEAGSGPGRAKLTTQPLLDSFGVFEYVGHVMVKRIIVNNASTSVLSQHVRRPLVVGLSSPLKERLLEGLPFLKPPNEVWGLLDVLFPVQPT